MPTSLHRTLVPLTFTLLATPIAMANEPLRITGSRLNDSQAPIFTTFTEATGIPVELVTLTMDELAEAMASEAEPPVDVIMVVDSSNIHAQVEAGWFQPFESEWIETRVPEALRNLEAGWSGYATRARVIYVNPDKLDWTPQSYEALADQRLTGQLCLGSGRSPYNVSLMSSMVLHHGEAEAERWARALVANLAQPTGGRDGELLRAVAEPGDCAVTVANHYYYLRMLESADEAERALAEQLELVWPNQEGEGLDGRGAYRNVAGFGMARGTPRAEAALRFLEHTAADEVQQDVAAGIFYPVVAEVGEANAQRRLGAARMDPASMSELGEHAEAARALLEKVNWQ
ncbi:extracellular solute-binding protein [Halomonas sp. MCCC 1A11062]|uniref:extracellular solute-binding protein n=1 Tax=Halomonas sp. MCCC 1A11062 TaxID=2733485 RepID=UPI001F1C45A7|nr:extracellular solute-binding protein [Halomonas sp. MCCC 1A11062]MCE8039765.1 extracellular solute-binding protein [Halomonas sp. MCCC 1A11062]